MSYCKVGYCRFSSSHVTKGHVCGKCGVYGHGDFECNNSYYRTRLQTYYGDTMPSHLECTVEDCTSKSLHSKEAHHCPVCYERGGHTVQECPKNSAINSRQTPVPKIYNIQCPICRVDNKVTNPRKIFGLNDECCICCDNKVEILFPTCYHCCICLACLEKDMM